MGIYKQYTDKLNNKERDLLIKALYETRFTLARYVDNEYNYSAEYNALIDYIGNIMQQMSRDAKGY